MNKGTQMCKLNREFNCGPNDVFFLNAIENSFFCFYSLKYSSLEFDQGSLF